MHIKRITKKSGVYLAQYESYRENGKVKTRFIKYLGKEGEEKNVPLPKKSAHVETPLYPESSKRAGDVKLMWTIADKELKMSKIIDTICCGDGNIEGKTPGKIITAWAINKALNPESATNVSEWVKTTILPELIGLPEDYFTDGAFYSSLDRICFKDNTADGFTDFSHLICDEMFKLWRVNHPLPIGTEETLAYDLTPVLIFGNGDELGEKGYNSKKENQKQINLCILVTKLDRIPVSYFLLPGNFNSMSSVKDLLIQLIDMAITPGTLIWDRGNTSEESIKDIENLGWKLICGVQKVSDDALTLLKETEVQVNVVNRVKSTGNSALYASRAEGELFGRIDAGIVYINMEKRMNMIDSRNELLTTIGEDLNQLKEDLTKLQNKEMEDKVAEIIGDYSDFFIIHIARTGAEYSLDWNYNEEAINNAIAFDGKYLLYSTNTSVKVSDIVKEYVGKDFIEKSFKTLKSNLKLAPVRHWKNHRIRAIFFINMMALWLRKIYDSHLNLINEKNRKYSFDEFLRRLKRVEYVEVRSSNDEKAFWYLNLTQIMVEQLKLMGFKDLFQEKRLNHM